MKDQIKLKVNDIVYETDDALTLYFKQPRFGKVGYKAGQFLTLIFLIDNREYRRAYSINTTQGVDQDIAVTIKKVKGGVISNHIWNHVRKGDKIPMLKPMGNFTLDPKKNVSRDIVLFGAGSGITPLMSILKSALYYEPESRVTLIYSNSHTSSIIFGDQIDIFKERFADRIFIKHLISERGERFEPTEVMNYVSVNPFFEQENTLFFICGPEAYMECVKDSLYTHLGATDDRVFNESFTLKKLESEAAYEVLFRSKAKEKMAPIPVGKSILDVGLELGFRFKFSCFNGQCGSCKSRCVAGKVKMAVDNILTDEEKSMGYVLPCVGVPESDQVVIEID